MGTRLIKPKTQKVSQKATLAGVSTCKRSFVNTAAPEKETDDSKKNVDVILEKSSIQTENQAEIAQNRIANLNQEIERRYEKDSSMVCLNPDVQGNYMVSRWENKYVRIPYQLEI